MFFPAVTLNLVIMCYIVLVLVCENNITYYIGELDLHFSLFNLKFRYQGFCVLIKHKSGDVPLFSILFLF